MKQNPSSYILLALATLPLIASPAQAYNERYRPDYDRNSYYNRNSCDHYSHGGRPQLQPNRPNNVQRATALFEESINVRKRYIDVIDQVINRQIRPRDAIQMINRLSDKLYGLGQKGDRLMGNLSMHEKRALGEILTGGRYAKQHRKTDRGLERVRENLRAVQYYQIEPLRQACRRFNGIARRSYLGN